ncbi:MAG: KOW domain-containing RNA-binding protein [Lachnospiraceae bacterium]|nr:KOW domain-containing RNA-binding protein [Lachnospiraceae bacterium]
MIGMFAASKAGHDKNQIYIIIEENDEYVYLAEGVLKTIDKPKKKSKKHIQIIRKTINEEIAEKLINKKPVQNEEIKRAIKLMADDKF